MKSFEEYTIKELGDLLSQMAEVVRLREEEKGVEFFEGGDDHEWKPKKGDWVEVVDDTGLFSGCPIRTGDIFQIDTFDHHTNRVTIPGRPGKSFYHISTSRLRPTSLTDPLVFGINHLPHFQIQEDLIQEQVKAPDGFVPPKEVHKFKMKPADEPEIIPAEPLAEIPKSGTILYAKVDGGVEVLKADQLPKYIIEDGRCFPDTPAGKLGAELRAKQGIVPYPVQPAKALTEPLEEGERYWLVNQNGEVVRYWWGGEECEIDWLSQGCIFPFTLAGKLGAAMFQEPKSE